MEAKRTKTIPIGKELFIKNIMDFETNTQEWVYLGDKPCIIDFYASWCGPCAMIAPILDELAEEYDGRIDIYKINTETERELAAAFGVRSIPTLIFCPMDDNPHQYNGALPKDEFVRIIDELLLKS
ncbi:MAG: thioredoxin [Weeksellaceae bacterium]|jgi:thioredoxin|nr:thioredoxin [Weeksellaceae bacterium]